MPEIKQLVIILLVILGVAGVAAGISYFYSQQIFLSQLLEKNKVIDDLQRQKVSTPVPQVTPTPTKPIVVEQELDCLQCHEIEQHKEFHVPQTIMEIDDSHGIRRRVCIDCHGPNGPPWNADEQMTDFEDIGFDSTAGVNGAFVLPNKVVHSIHKRKLDSGVLSCEFCHFPPGSTGMELPQVKTDLGRVLYCQNEGCHDSEGGNYIAIHVELRPFKCTTCHTGEIIGIHLRFTERLGKFVNQTHVTTH